MKDRLTDTWALMVWNCSGGHEILTDRASREQFPKFILTQPFRREKIQAAQFEKI